LDSAIPGKVDAENRLMDPTINDRAHTDESVVAANLPPLAKATRRFEFTSDSSNKFWEITLDGSQHIVRYGRIGTNGQSVTKTFPDSATAKRDYERLIRNKEAKGYREK
jgi:predicted DNA-binding WGR domain protein